MPYYIVKNDTGNFYASEQPKGFKALGGGALENRFFICECPTVPVTCFAVVFPEEELAKHVFYQHPNGRKLPCDPFEGRVKFGDVVDNKNRRAIIYSEEQLAIQLSIIKWLALNVWIPDKKRMYEIPEEIVQSYIDAINKLTDAEDARVYIRKNLYYNL